MFRPSTCPENRDRYRVQMGLLGQRVAVAQQECQDQH